MLCLARCWQWWQAHGAWWNQQLYCSMHQRSLWIVSVSTWPFDDQVHQPEADASVLWPQQTHWLHQQELWWRWHHLDQLWWQRNGSSYSSTRTNSQVHSFATLRAFSQGQRHCICHASKQLLSALALHKSFNPYYCVAICLQVTHRMTFCHNMGVFLPWAYTLEAIEKWGMGRKMESFQG